MSRAPWLSPAMGDLIVSQSMEREANLAADADGEGVAALEELIPGQGRGLSGRPPPPPTEEPVSEKRLLAGPPALFFSRLWDCS